jgi:hypothetical protein
MHLFVFDKGYGTQIYFVYKTWAEIEEMERSKGPLIDDEQIAA